MRSYYIIILHYVIVLKFGHCLEFEHRYGIVVVRTAIVGMVIFQ